MSGGCSVGCAALATPGSLRPNTFAGATRKKGPFRAGKQAGLCVWPAHEEEYKRIQSEMWFESWIQAHTCKPAFYLF